MELLCAAVVELEQEHSFKLSSFKVHTHNPYTHCTTLEDSGDVGTWKKTHLGVFFCFLHHVPDLGSFDFFYVSESLNCFYSVLRSRLPEAASL